METNEYGTNYLSDADASAINDAWSMMESKQKEKKKVNIIIQSPLGGNITTEEILQKIGDVDTVYVRIDQNKLYGIHGKEVKTVDIW